MVLLLRELAGRVTSHADRSAPLCCAEANPRRVTRPKRRTVDIEKEKTKRRLLSVIVFTRLGSAALSRVTRSAFHTL